MEEMEEVDGDGMGGGFNQGQSVGSSSNSESWCVS